MQGHRFVGNAVLPQNDSNDCFEEYKKEIQFAIERKLTDKMAETLELIGKAFEGNWSIDWGVIDEVLTEYKKARGEE